MCGIVGFYLNRPLDNADISLGKQALELLYHRGPDDQRCWYNEEEGIFLGHTRLSIIDLSDDNAQPIESDGAVMTYNGEIYNYKQLRKELESEGHQFRTTGDTEVLMHTLNESGIEGISHLDGMFAFAHYRNRKLLLATDYFGEKPLYIYQSKDGFYFCSEATPLIKLLKLEANLSAEEEGYFMGLGYLPAPFTGYKGLQKLAPAHFLTFDPESGKSEQKAYWSPELVPHSDRKQVIEKTDLAVFQQQLIASVESRLEADVPVGVFLSAGVDSMLLAAILKKELSKDNLCLTVRFKSDHVTDESELAKKSADYLGLNHLILDQEDTFQGKNELEFLANAYGELNDNLTLISAYAMSVKAREHVKVALSGTGGDELFYGYNKYAGLQLIQELKRKYAALKPLYGPMNLFSGLSKKLERLIRYLKISDEHAYLLIKNYQGYPHLKKHTKLLDLVAGSYQGSVVEAGRSFDVRHSLPYSYIPYIERGSMQASLEVRAPFLNRELYELTNQFSAGAFLQHGQKWVLKSILENYLPKPYFDHSKMGFINPREDFLVRNFGEAAMMNLSQKFSPSGKQVKNAGITDLVLRRALLDLGPQPLN